MKVEKKGGRFIKQGSIYRTRIAKRVKEVVRRPRNPTAVYTFVWLVSLTGNWII